MITVLIVDDSAIIRSILKQILGKDSRFNIIGEASNGQDAISKNKLLHPDLIIMDINMPVMNGIDATRTIMKEEPTSIVIFSTEDTAKYGFEGINAGALEMIPKPDLASSSSEFYETFKEKLFLLGSKNQKQKVQAAAVVEQVKNISSAIEMIMIGASTGGPAAVQKVISDLGKDISVPVLITQHIDISFAGHYAPWLAQTTGLNVRFAVDGEPCLPGTFYIAPADYHLTITKDDASNKFFIRLTSDEPVHFLRPAVDPMFFSGAKCAKAGCLGILLTGMGRDGADGCVELKKQGAFTICEAEETCAVFGMPKAAIEDGGATAVLPLDKIGSYVRTMMGQ